MNSVIYKRYLLLVLMLVLAFNGVDRLVLALVAQDVKNDLHLTDTQLGLLGGIAFALFYGTMGIPIARWADRGNRVTIIAVTTAAWSVAVVVCGMAHSFVQLMLTRMAVGIGEAGVAPTAQSLIPDHFNRQERPWAMGIYFLGVPISALIGNAAAGWINQFYGWRATFFVLGLPGVVLAVLAALTLREPRNGLLVLPKQEQAQQPAPPNFLRTCATLSGNATFRHLVVAASLVTLINGGLALFMAIYFMRSFKMQTGELGTWLATINVAAGFLGNYLGGAWASSRAANNEPLQLKVTATVLGGGAVLFAGMYLTHDKYIAFGLLAVHNVFGFFANVPLWAMLQTIVSARMRATATAILYMIGNLIGLGLGPVLAGALSDHLSPTFGEESVRYASLALIPGYLWGALHMWLAHRTVRHDVAIAELDGQPVAYEKTG